jgi:AAA ATPase domain
MSMGLSAAIDAELGALYNAVSDRVLQPDDPAYVPGVNQSAQDDPIREIWREITFQQGGGVCLLSGQRGTGKSTELQRLKRRLEDQQMSVFYVNLAEFLVMSKPVEVTDFLLAVAGGLSDALARQYDGATPGNRGYWERFLAFARTKVEFNEASIRLTDAVELKAALYRDPDFKRQLQEASRGHVVQLVQQAHVFFADAVQFVRERQQNLGRKVVVIVDSIEQLRGIGDEAMRVFDSVRNLFHTHGDSLRVPLVHMVYTVPPYLPALIAAAGASMGGAFARHVVSVRVCERDRTPDSAGLAVMRDVANRRHADLPRLVSSDALNDLAIGSGGDLREFFRLIQACLPRVRDDADLPITLQSAQSAKRALRNSMLPIPADQLDWLKRVGDTHQHELRSPDDVPMLAQLLDSRLILCYRNGDEWHDVHPLLRDVIDAHQTQDRRFNGASDEPGDGA